MLIWSLLAALQAAPAQSTVQTTTNGSVVTTRPSAPAPADKRLDQAVAAIRSAKAADALPLLDAIIADFDRAHPPKANVMVFSASNMTQTLMYSVLPATQKKNGIVVDGAWSLAHFLKGFALVDLKRSDEALAQFDRAIALSPMNSQYLGERGEYYKSRKQWDKAYADFKSAADFSTFSDEADRTSAKGRGLRGMAFVMIEKGELKQAQKLLKEALKLNPNDAGARHELDYLKSLK
jgi:tetratricopeptide (TPR) repeat protein